MIDRVDRGRLCTLDISNVKTNDVQLCLSVNLLANFGPLQNCPLLLSSLIRESLKGLKQTTCTQPMWESDQLVAARTTQKLFQ